MTKLDIRDNVKWWAEHKHKSSGDIQGRTGRQSMDLSDQHS